MHEQIVNFKAGFDILGTRNTAQTVRNIPITKVYPWSNGKPHNTMHLVRTFITNEGRGRFNWDDPSGQKQLVILTQDSPNVYGECPGYRIVPGQPAGATRARLTVIDSPGIVRLAG